MRSTPFAPRFAIEEHRAESIPRLRKIGDFRVSGINDIGFASDTDIPEGLDTTLAAARHYLPIAGEIPPTGALVPRARPASCPLAEWRDAIPERNRATIDRLERRQDSAPPRACRGVEVVRYSGWLGVDAQTDRRCRYAFYAVSATFRNRRVPRGVDPRSQADRRFPREWDKRHRLRIGYRYP